MTETRDALSEAPLGPLVEEARANHVRWQHEAEYLEECGRELCIGAKLLLWPDIEDPRDSFPLPDGWVLARREDAEDGAALRELREALGDDTLMRLENLMPDTPREGGSDLWLVEVEVDAPGEPTVLVADATGPTIAAAARKAREALG